MNTHDNFLVNFSLNGFTSILIGFYFLATAYGIQFVLDGFLIDGNLMGMMSAQIIEFIIIAIVLLLLIFSCFALYFRGRRYAKRYHYKLWNGKTKRTFGLFLLSIIGLFFILYFLLNKGFVTYITPIFLLFYSFLVFVLKNKKNKKILIITGLSLFLALICFLIPSYWQSSLLILGTAHIVYGLVIRK